jgi:hypothetical protein
MALRDAINATGRPMILSSEPFTVLPDPRLRDVAHLWRTTKDIKATWAAVTERIDLNDKFADISGPGMWAVGGC